MLKYEHLTLSRPLLQGSIVILGTGIHITVWITTCFSGSNVVIFAFA